MSDARINKHHLLIGILLMCGVVAGPLFMIVVLINGYFTSDYTSFRYPLSSLAISAQGWIQIINFLLAGLLIVAFAVGVRLLHKYTLIKFRGSLLLAIVGIGLLGAGLFVTDPLFGYPEHLAIKLTQFSVHGRLHDAFSILVFVCLPWACFLFRKQFIQQKELKYAQYSSIAGWSMIFAFILASAGFKQVGYLNEFAGLFQRICMSIGCLWLTVIAWYLWKRSRYNFITA